MKIDPELEVLRQAVAGNLPATIHLGSTAPVLIVKDLVASGHLDATNASNLDGPAFINPRITALGRERLGLLEERAHKASIRGKLAKYTYSTFKWVFGIVAAVVVAFLVKHFIS